MLSTLPRICGHKSTSLNVDATETAPRCLVGSDSLLRRQRGVLVRPHLFPEKLKYRFFCMEPLRISSYTRCADSSDLPLRWLGGTPLSPTQLQSPFESPLFS